MRCESRFRSSQGCGPITLKSGAGAFGSFLPVLILLFTISPAGASGLAITVQSAMSSPGGRSMVRGMTVTKRAAGVGGTTHARFWMQGREMPVTRAFDGKALDSPPPRNGSEESE